MAIRKTPFNLRTLPAPEASFSRGLEVTLGDCRLIFISGTASVGPEKQTMYPGDFEKQVRHTYQNVADLLASRGATFRDVVKWTVFLSDMARYEAFCLIREQIFREQGIGRDDYAASTCVEARLCRPDLEVEVEAIAVVEAGR
jgi:enamine deaminase RidA (YjgF/YER057c/UK114 family)